MRAVQRGDISQGVGVNCDSCRAQMSTETLLSKLRCAECRQISHDHFIDVGINTALIAMAGVLAWICWRARDRGM